MSEGHIFKSLREQGEAVRKALAIAREKFDDYNHLRFSQFQVMVIHGNRLTIAEQHDLWTYIERKGQC